MEKLSKENFWNEITEKFTGEAEQFYKWIDQYKEKNDWNGLFNSVKIEDRKYFDWNGEAIEIKAPKFHDLPNAMQIGIFIQYVSESGSRYGISLPLIESVGDFEKIKKVIYDFFYYEHESASRDKEKSKIDIAIDNDVNDVEFEE